MDILMLLFNPVGKGTYWRALHLARNLERRGHKLTIMATPRVRRLNFDLHLDDKSNVTLVESPDLHLGPLSFGWDPFNTIARIGWARKHNFDLLHAFEARPTVIFPALFWQRFRKTPLILDWCDWFGRGGSVEERPAVLLRKLLSPFETFFEKHFRKYADGTTVINAFLREKAIELGVSSESIHLLTNGSDTEGLDVIPVDEARRFLGFPQDVFLIGYIGAIFQRDAILMAQAFNRVIEVAPNARLLLIGYCNVDVEKYINEPIAVWRTGILHYEAINHNLSACDVCWLPFCDSGANKGRFPLKLNDYMSVGRPVVVTDIESIGELVRKEEFGLVAADKPEDLAQKILILLNNPLLRKEMGQRARDLAETKFSWDFISNDLAQFYQVVKNRKITG